ncbi:MAG: glycosyltransferase [Bacteroidia bacterium]|nr:glycosyltransferase [Bacteroidia bacterium]
MDLILMTHRFPFDKGEEFLEKEVTYLSESFGKVVFIPSGEISGKTIRPLPANCTVFYPEKPFRATDPFSVQNIFEIIRVFFLTAKAEFRSTLKPLLKLPQLKHVLKEIGYALHWKNQIRRAVAENRLEKFQVYSYWLDSWLIAPILLRNEYPGLKIVSRVHGYDLYFERGFLGYQPFRPWLLKNLDGLYPVSQTGKIYLERRFPGIGRLETAYLGVEKQEVPNQPSTDGILRVVSCAMMIPLKRIHLLIEALGKLAIPVEWTHFGDGSLEETLHIQAGKLPRNIRWTFAGNLRNSELMEYYRTHPVDVFVNTSETEGIPVTIMEAISFGIPAIGPDVGGVAEVVNDQYGFLLESDFSPETLAQKLYQLAQMETDEIEKRRNFARTFFLENFYAGTNFPAFCQQISGEEKRQKNTVHH